MKSYAPRYLFIHALFAIAPLHGMNYQVTPYLNTGKLYTINPKNNPSLMAKMATVAPIAAPLLINQGVMIALNQVPALIARTIPNAITSTLVAIPVEGFIKRYVTKNPYTSAGLQSISISASGIPNLVVNTLTNAHIIPQAPPAANYAHLGAQYIICYAAGIPISKFTHSAVYSLFSDDVEKKEIMAHRKSINMIPEDQISDLKNQLKKGLIPALSSWNDCNPLSTKDAIDITFEDRFEHR